MKLALFWDSELKLSFVSIFVDIGPFLFFFFFFLLQVDLCKFLCIWVYKRVSKYCHRQLSG